MSLFSPSGHRATLQNSSQLYALGSVVLGAPLFAASDAADLALDPKDDSVPMSLSHRPTLAAKRAGPSRARSGRGGIGAGPRGVQTRVTKLLRRQQPPILFFRPRSLPLPSVYASLGVYALLARNHDVANSKRSLGRFLTHPGPRFSDSSCT